MNLTTKPVLGHLRHIDPPRHLHNKIITRIRVVEQKSLQIRLVFQSIGAVVSLFLLIPAYQFASTEWVQSEFGSYLSLIFSDSALAFTYWKELLISLGESIPLLGISALASVFLIGLSTLKVSAHNLFSFRQARSA